MIILAPTDLSLVQKEALDLGDLLFDLFLDFLTIILFQPEFALLGCPGLDLVRLLLLAISGLVKCSSVDISRLQILTCHTYLSLYDCLGGLFCVIATFFDVSSRSLEEAPENHSDN